MQASTGAIIFYFFTLSTTITIHHQPGKCVGVKVKWWPWHFVSLCALWHFVAAQLKLLTHAPAQPSPLHRTYQRPPLKSSPTAEIAFTILLLKSNIPSFSSSDRDEHGAEHFKRGVGWLVGWLVGGTPRDVWSISKVNFHATRHPPLHPSQHLHCVQCVCNQG